MGTKRNVEKLVSVFDLSVAKTPDVPINATARVLFVYDQKTGTRKFVIVRTDIPRSHVSGIISWLEKNIDVDHLAFGLKSNRLEVSWPQDSFRPHPG